MVDRIGICHSISLIYIAHVAVIIRQNLRLYGLPVIIAEITHCWWVMVRPRLYVVKCHITADYLQTSLFIHIYVTAVGIISPVQLARELLTFYIQVMGKP